MGGGGRYDRQAFMYERSKQLHTGRAWLASGCLREFRWVGPGRVGQGRVCSFSLGSRFWPFFFPKLDMW